MDEDSGIDRRVLAAFLAARDADCPACGYNLRAAAGTQCPECGDDLVLSLRHPSRLWGRRGLLGLVFGFLLLAGLMQAIRSGLSVHALLSSGPQTVVWTTVMPPRPPGAGFGMGGGPGAGSGLGFGSTRPQGTVQVLVPSPPSSGWQWSNVSIGQWTVLGGWSVLTIAAAAGLLVTIVLARRAASDSASRLLVTLAWLGCGAYLSTQGLLFLREIL